MEKKDKLQLNKYQSVGAIHVHTLFSDGTGDIETISRAAKQAGLDWVIVTDHNSFEIKEGIYNGVYIIKGEEISPFNNHYLALGIKQALQPKDNPKHNVEAVQLNGGFGFAAHPDESDNRNNTHRAIKWVDKNVMPDGVEIWNWFSSWADNLDDRNIFSLAYAYLFKNYMVKRPNIKTLQWWDYLNNRKDKIVPAIGGIDAHALKVKKYFIPVTIFPYSYMFKTIINVISSDISFSSDFATRKEQILSALKEGRNLIINREVTHKPVLICIKNSNKVAVSGENISLDNRTFLFVKTAIKALIKVFRNGQEIKSVISNSFKLLLDTVGKYRVEIIIGDRGFAYSNPIIVY